MIEKILISIAAGVLLFSVSVLDAAVVTGVIRSESDSAASAWVKNYASEALEKYAAFTSPLVFVNQKMLAEQMAKFSCTDESCLLGFARDAKIELLIFVSAYDEGASVRIVFTARGSGVPYGGKAVVSYSALVAKSGIGAKTSDPLDEHCGLFLSKLLEKFQQPVEAVNESGRLKLPIDGVYRVYRRLPESPDLYYSDAGEDTFVQGYSLRKYANESGYFVLIDFKKESRYFSQYLYGRKHEMVFSRGLNYTHSALLFMLPVISFLSPAAAPLGYFSYSDYKGLFLSGAAAAPWAVVSAKGLYRAFWEDNGCLSRNEKARRDFGLYWLFAGNAAIVIDMFAHEKLSAVRNYQQGEYLGSTTVAVSLAVLTNGGGMFYRGNRLFGHLYYQAGNILLYKTFEAFSKNERTDSSTGRRVSEKYDRKKAAAWLGGFIALKAVEITQTIFTKDPIEADHTIANVEVFPVMEYSDGIQAGAGIAYRW